MGIVAVTRIGRADTYPDIARRRRPDARFARHEPEVRVVDPDAQHRLQALVTSLRKYQAELDEARRNGLDFVAERALEEIHKRREMIRRHCAENGLFVPREVSEEESEGL